MSALRSYGISMEHDTAVAGKTNSKEHTHAFHEIYFLVSGKRRYLMRDTIYDVAPGELVFVPREQLHCTTSITKAGYHRYAVYFDRRQESLFAPLVGQTAIDTLLHSGCMRLPEEATAHLHRDLEQLQRILEEPGALTFAMATHVLQDILLTALRHGIPKQPCCGESANRIQLVAHYITEHYSNPITLSSAARLACMEETYFSRKFRELTGFSFLDYLTRQRLLEARRLLRETNLSIGQIADSCGFSGANYFGDVFLRRYGMSPSAYRKEQYKS